MPVLFTSYLIQSVWLAGIQPDQRLVLGAMNRNVGSISKRPRRKLVEFSFHDDGGQSLATVGISGMWCRTVWDDGEL